MVPRRTLATAVLALSLPLLGAFAPASDALPKSTVRLACDTAVRVQVRLSDRGEWQNWGTAWPAIDQTTLITAKHVVDGYDDLLGHHDFADVRAVFPVGNAVRLSAKKLYADNDVAMLALDARDVADRPHPLLRLAKKDAEVGDRLMLVGYGQDYDRLLAVGYATCVEKDDTSVESDRMTMSVVVIPGHSGSAVLDDEGEVVGLAVSRREDFPMESQAIPVSAIRKCLAYWRIAKVDD